MATDNLRQRQRTMPAPLPDFGGGTKEKVQEGEEHPAGEIKHGGPKQLLRFFTFVAYFWTCCCV